jgi:hypothetical protein
MHVSHALGVAIAVAVYILTLIFRFNFGPIGIVLRIIFALLIIMPYIGAGSKSIRAHFFFKYDSILTKNVKDD